MRSKAQKKNYPHNQVFPSLLLIINEMYVSKDTIREMGRKIKKSTIQPYL